MLLNQSRAYEIMDQRGLDGLIAHLPINVYYLTDYWSDVMAAGFDCACFGLFPRREDAPAALIIMALETRHLVSTDTWVPNIVTYTGEPTDEDQATADGGNEQRLGETRRTFEDTVTARQNTDHQLLENLFLADNDFLDFRAQQLPRLVQLV